MMRRHVAAVSSSLGPPTGADGFGPDGGWTLRGGHEGPSGFTQGKLDLRLDSSRQPIRRRPAVPPGWEAPTASLGKITKG